MMEISSWSSVSLGVATYRDIRFVLYPEQRLGPLRHPAFLDLEPNLRLYTDPETFLPKA